LREAMALVAALSRLVLGGAQSIVPSGGAHRDRHQHDQPTVAHDATR
jgi:hypothetical protein